MVPDAGRCILCGFHTYSGSDFAAHCETAGHVAQVRARLASGTRSALVSPGTGHICAGTGLTRPTSAPGLRSPPATSAPGLGSPRPHLRRDCSALVSPGARAHGAAMGSTRCRCWRGEPSPGQMLEG